MGECDRLTIPTWAHGNKPTAANLNEYKTAFDAANSAIAGGTVQLPAEHVSEAIFGVMHCYRYLHYGSSGALVDPTGQNESVSLSDDDSGHGVLDLDGLGWMPYGRRYEVTGVTWCQEDVDP